MVKNIDSDFGKDTVQQVKNEQDFECLYKTYWKKVFGIIYHYTEDREISAELSQELFATIWEQRETLVFHQHAKAYLFKAAKLEAFDYIRTSLRRKQLLACALQDFCQLQNCTEETLMYNELRGKLDLLVNKLPCRCREVYHLSQTQGFSNSTIAGMLGISGKTVEYHLYKAMSFLREQLAPVKS